VIGEVEDVACDRLDGARQCLELEGDVELHSVVAAERTGLHDRHDLRADDHRRMSSARKPLLGSPVIAVLPPERKARTTSSVGEPDPSVRCR
jgi:hypothetical protein